MTSNFVYAGDLMAQRASSVDPSKFPNEEFELHSIPAFDAGKPEILTGDQIGSTKKLVEPNDVMLSKIVPHIRRSSIVPEFTGRRQIASSEWIVFRNRQFFPDYLRHALTSNTFHAKFMATVSGVGGSLLRARPAEVAKIKIPLPPLAEQRRLADLLSRAEGIVRLRREAAAKATELIPALFLDMFGDPASNPKDWPLVPFGELGQLDRGKSRHRPRDAQELYDGPYPFVQTGDVANSGGRITRYTQTYSELGLAQSRLWPMGTLCITIAANIARTGVLEFDACFPDSVVGFTAGNGVTTEYIQHWLGFLQPMLEANAPQAAQKNINLSILRNLPVPAPPITLQHQFAAKAEAIRAIATQQTAALATAQATFDALLHRAFAR
ncbi:MAG: restriction endonuclease subunit S [Pseudoxanthomonas sp.]